MESRTPWSAPGPKFWQPPRKQLSVKDEWKYNWNTAEYGRDLYRLGVRPGKKILKTHEGIHRASSSLITQMCTAKIGLRAYLHSIDKAVMNDCQFGYGPQSVCYVLLECRA